MSRLARNFWCSIALALSDFVGFTIAMYIAIATVKICLTNGEVLVINSHIDDWMAFHVCLGLCCVAWYGSLLCYLVLDSFASLYLPQAILV